jgi:hypothetical protein
MLSRSREKAPPFEGVTNGRRIVGMRVLDINENVVASFDLEGVVANFDLEGKAIVRPLPSDEDTSSLRSHP